MANINNYISQIRRAIFGEEVRESIIGALQAANVEAQQATVNAGQAVDAAETAIQKVEENDLSIAVMQEGLNAKVDGAYKDDEGFLYLTSNDEVVVGPLGPFAGSGGGGGGGGSAENNALLSMTNTTGWLFGTFADGQDCTVSFNWSSVEGDIPTGAGSLRILAGGMNADTIQVDQGPVSLNLKKYLKAGTNAIRLTLTDAYGNQKYINFTIKVVAVSITSSFDASVPFEGTIQYTYIPTGAVAKTVHFLLDGTELGTQIVSSSGRQQTYLIPAQAHGSHTFEVYFTAIIEGVEVESNRLFYDLICIQDGTLTPIISVDFNRTQVSQYESVIIPYQIYDPSSLTSTVTLKQGDKVLNTLTVDRTKQTWTYRASTAGDMALTIECGETRKMVNFTVTETVVNVAAETRDLQLYLTSYGRSNGEATKDVWTSRSVAAQFQNFNWVSDGWQNDEDGITVMRVGGNARLTIPFKIFATDFRTSGKTIEIELATRDVRNYDAVILSCMSGGRGLQMTGQMATLQSEQSKISMQYKEGEHVRISFVVTKRNQDRLIHVYIDGCLSGTYQYPETDDFSQISPVDITVGSSECTVDLYTIRVYDNNLTMTQIVDNWIADTQIGELMLDRYMHNDVFDDYDQIVIDKLPKNLPYIIWEAEYLPQYKGNKVQVKGSYVDPVDSRQSFTFLNTVLDVQGTSSATYPRKNFKQKFPEGFVTSQGTIEKRPLVTGALPVNVYCFKADVASSEGCNNVELVRLYNDSCPVKTPPMASNESIRWGIDGFPIVAFFKDTASGNVTFIGKYNFNNDKSTEEVFGFAAGDESWEIKNNTSDRVIFENDDFSGTAWQDDFEARYPEDNTNTSKLKAMVTWVKSTKNNPTKFKAELAQHFNVRSSLFYWLFTEMFLMVDSRAKNAFPTYFAADQRWYWLPYDFDTALGINNEGELVFGYSYEDTDHLPGGADIFNGQKSIFWNNLREAYKTELQEMYQKLRSDKAWTYEKVLKMFEDHQAKWPISVVNEDSKFKYLDPLTNEGDGSYLGMLQGLKKSQRQWWLYNRFRYMDAKYIAGDALTDVITLRGYAKDDITVTPYADIYVTVKYGSALVTERGYRNQSYLMACPLDNVNDTEIYIYSAPQMASVGDLSGLKVGLANFAAAEKLQILKLGDASSSYSNPNLVRLDLGNNRLLKTVDLRNCTAFAQTIDLSGCKNVEEIFLEGTQVTGITLPNGGILKKLHLPATLKNLTVQNQTLLSDLVVPSWSNITTLRLENAGTAIDVNDILNHIPSSARVRLTGVHFEVESVSEIETLYDLFDTFRGLDEAGNNVEKAQIAGDIHIPNILGSQVAELLARYPYIKINADHISCTVKYYSWDGSSLLHTETVMDGGNATYTGQPSRSSTAQYSYAFAGWSRDMDGSAWPQAQKAVTSDRTLYAAYTATVRRYTVHFYNGSTLLQTVQNVAYGGSATYTGSTPVDPSGNGQPFTGWEPKSTNIQGNTACYAQFQPPITDTIADDWATIVSNIETGAAGAECGYEIGATKIVDWGGDIGRVAMQLVAVDEDNLADGSGKAKTSWLPVQLGKTWHRMNPAYSEVTHTETTNHGPMWVPDEASGGYRSNNQGRSGSTAKAIFTLTPTESGTLTLSYKVGSEENYDKLIVKLGGTVVASGISGEVDWTDHEVEVTEGTALTVEVIYTKDGSGDKNGDTAYIKWSGVGVSATANIADITTSTSILDSITDNTGTLGGWEHCEMRAFIKSHKENLPAILQAHIKPVIKTQNAYRIASSGKSTESYTQTTTDDLWIPDYSEMFSTSASVRYTRFFTDATSRKKKRAADTGYNNWWLRSAGSATNFRCVYNDGSSGSINASYSDGVVPGFCI